MLADSFGLNKEARLRAEQKKRSDLEEAPLNPRFPYEVMAFDDTYFRAEPSDIHEDAKGGGASGGGFVGGGGEFGGGGASGRF